MKTFHISFKSGWEIFHYVVFANDNIDALNKIPKEHKSLPLDKFRVNEIINECNFISVEDMFPG